jgi:excisionase family DNA binding protein
VQEVARLVRVSERTVWRELKSGRLRGTRFGGQWRILDSDLHTYLDQRATVPAG